MDDFASTIAARPPAEGAETYRLAKRWLYDEVVADRRQTLYCDCAFSADRRPQAAACGYQPRARSERTRRVEVEHVVPASWIGQGRACWRDQLCTDAKGRRFGGRKCCAEIDPDYRRAAFDLHNLWPALGELNEARGSRAFGLIPGEPRAFGRCDFEIAGRQVEPRPAVRGDIARIAFYMEQVHGVWLSDRQRSLFVDWNRADPPDAFERERDARIARLQGRGNPFVTDYQRRLVQYRPANAGVQVLQPAN